MSDPIPADPTGLFVLCLFYLLPALAVTIAMVSRARRAVGPVIAAQRPKTRARRLLVFGALAIVATIVWVRGDLPDTIVAACLATAAAIAALAPGFKDAICGETGVQRGWYARRFEELEEWRMAGEHLRFRLFGEWTSVPLPPTEQLRVREKLLSICPDRESRFRD